MANSTLFAQIISQLPKGSIKKIIKKSGTDKYCYRCKSQSGDDGDIAQEDELKQKIQAHL